MPLAAEQATRMSVPSIKGTAFQGVHADVNALLECGRISRAELEVRLEPEDMNLLDQKVGAATWYPIETYERLVELLVELESGGDRVGYLLRRGAKAAERLSAAGIYQQLDASREELGPQVGKMIITLAGVIYNFVRFDIELGDAPGSFTARLECDIPLPEVSRYATQGFMEFVATRVTGTPVKIESSCPSRFGVVYEARAV